MKPDSVHVVWPDAAAPVTISAIGGNLAERLRRAGRPLNTRCGQRGLCAGCTVHLTAGSFRQHDGTIISAPAEIKACQGQPVAATVEVPARALAAHRPQVVTTFKLGVTAAHAPLVPAVAGGHGYGLAIDIGTTTVVVALADLADGRIVAEESSFNRQMEFGDDVLTRIELAGTGGKLPVLREAINVHTLAPLIARACATVGISPARLGGAVIAGNTTMLHLLTGTDPTSLGVAPFRPVFIGHRVLTAGSLGWPELSPDLPVHLLPGFSAYVGADLVAGAICTGLLNTPGPDLLVDIGTNGEILLRQGERLFVTATAAGPAFEGGRLSRGTRAAAGAIAHVALSGDGFSPALEIIPGQTRVVGICGSAYVDFLAEARRTGLLGFSGRFDSAAWASLPAAHRRESEEGRGILLQAGEPASLITEADIAHLLQAKAAIATGILMLLGKAGLAPAGVNRLLLAGGFGLHLNVPHAIACGLLPGFSPAQVEVVGNTALGGAWLALVDGTVLPEMSAAGTAAEVVELNLEPGFEDTFIDQLALP